MRVMLRFEIVTDKQMSDIEFLKGKTFFMNIKEIEEEFIGEMYFSDETFSGTLSDKLLMELENGAVRTEKYGIKTSEGEMCISCISPEAKFALLVLKFAEKYPGHMFIVDPSDLRLNVFKWLNDNIDITMYIPFLNMVENPQYDLWRDYGIKFIWNGEEIENLLDWVLQNDNLTKNTVRTGFQRSFRYNRMLSFSPEGIPYVEFIRNFADEKYTPEEPDEYESTYIVRTEQGQYCFSDIVAKYVWAFGVYEKEGGFFSKLLTSVKWPTIPELLRDVLEFVRKEAADRATIIVTIPDESHLLRNYTEQIYFGLLIDARNRTLDFLSRNVSAIMYHNALEKVDIPLDAPLRVVEW